MLGKKVYIWNQLKFKSREETGNCFHSASLRLTRTFWGKCEVVHWIAIIGVVLRKHRRMSAHAWRFSV